MKRSIVLLALLATACIHDVSRVNGPKLPFVDQAATDPTFVQFRDELRAIARHRDRAALLRHVDPNIRTSFGDSNGVASLETNEMFWTELRQVLDLGGTFRDGMFWAPYVYSAWPEDIDAFSHVAVTGQPISMRSLPQEASTVVAVLDHDIVTRDAFMGSWSHVRTADGRDGWVPTERVRSPVGYRAGFAKTPKGWRMTAFVSGD